MKKFYLLVAASALLSFTSAYAGGLSLPAALSQPGLPSLGALPSMAALPAMPSARGEGPPCSVCLPTWRPSVSTYAARVQPFVLYYANASNLPGLPTQMQNNLPRVIQALGFGITTGVGKIGGPAPVPKRPADIVDSIGYQGLDPAVNEMTEGPFIVH
jgi:hypothetical protein